jgi:hypothetical protein
MSVGRTYLIKDLRAIFPNIKRGSLNYILLKAGVDTNKHEIIKNRCRLLFDESDVRKIKNYLEKNI